MVILSKFKNAYFQMLPVVFIPSTMFGLFIGVAEISDKTARGKDVTPFDVFVHVIGYSTIGAAVAYAYPVTFPMAAFYVLYKKRESP